MTRLSIAEITKLLIELSNGIPIEQLLQTYSISRRTIYRHKARFESGLVGPKKRDKRKCKLNANQLLTLKRHCLMNPFETNSMILHKLNLRISATRQILKTTRSFELYMSTKISDFTCQ